MTTEVRSVSHFNVAVHRASGMGKWRRVYLPFITALDAQSVVELGSGDPTFLSALSSSLRRVALDGGDRFRQATVAQGIEFYTFDFDNEPPPVTLEHFDVAVCSDVFEHLLYPERSLDLLSSMLTPQGVLFSHVPNEFTYKKTLKIMRGQANSIYFHKHCEEWNNPHLRRFTDVGFRRFLARRFTYHLPLTDLQHSRLARLITRLGLRVPYGLEKGPTYASTNSAETFEKLVGIKRDIGTFIPLPS